MLTARPIGRLEQDQESGGFVVYGISAERCFAMVLPQVSSSSLQIRPYRNDVDHGSLEIDPAKVDVNVSPTKSEVHFLNQDEMIDGIVTAIQTVLAGANTSRSFAVQVPSSLAFFISMVCRLMPRPYCLVPPAHRINGQNHQRAVNPLRTIKSVWTLPTEL